ncbi:hypothetical protein OAZ97_00220 [Prochlorococcus sp. AH-736-E15]|nr:hypothetical protein [Prochlorococcus sp. AH-736-E15]
MSYPSRDEILSYSKGWVASFLNFLPGLGSGYLYQRRWKPYFFTITAITAWLALGFFLQGDSEPSQSEQIIGISGLFFISIVTVIEANLAFKKASNKKQAEKEKTISSKKKGWFK